MRSVTFVIPTYNEEENVKEIYLAIKTVVQTSDDLDYKFLFIDNDSTDETQSIITDICRSDITASAIFNQTNFGPVRSPFYGLISSNSDAAVLIAADFQEPPSLIPEFIKHWKNGDLVIAGVRTSSDENPYIYKLRKTYYRLLNQFSETPLLTDFTGFALYDKSVIKQLRNCEDPYPYLRGLISELGYTPKKVYFHQPLRKAGTAKGGIYNLLNFAALGFVNHSKAPLRLCIVCGLFLSVLSFLVAVIYFTYKLVFWNSFQLGMAPLVIGLFFFASVQLFFLGVVGEYIGNILTHIKKRPLVLIKKTLNINE